MDALATDNVGLRRWFSAGCLVLADGACFNGLLGLEEAGGGEVGVAGEVDAEPSESGLVARARDVGEVDLAAAEFFEFIHGELGGGVGGGADGEGDEGLFEVEADGGGVEDILLEARDGLDDGG